MPIYVYECKKCGVIERRMPVSEHSSYITCGKCGCMAQQVITPPTVHIPADMRADFNPYESPATGRPISTSRQRREDLASSGCVEYDPEMLRDSERIRAEADSKLEREIDDTVEREISKLDSDSVNRLGAELESNDIGYERV